MMLGTQRDSLGRFVKGHKVPKRWKQITSKVHTKEISLFPSPELSYIIGVFVGDGWAYSYNKGYYICLEARDRDFVEFFREEMAKITSSKHPILTRQRYGAYFHKTCGYSKKLYEFLRDKDYKDFLYGKSSFPKRFTEVIEMFPANFIQGVIDSEGSISFDPIKGYSFTITICNTSKKLLDYIKQLLLMHCGIKANVRKSKEKGVTNTNFGYLIKSTRPYYVLTIFGKEKHKFAKYLGFRIERKHKILLKAINHKDMRGRNRPKHIGKYKRAVCSLAT